MRVQIDVLIFIGIILLLPIQNASAGWIEDNFTDAQKDIFYFLQKLPIIIQQYYDNTLDQTLLSEISIDLLEFQKINPEGYDTLSEWFPDIEILVDTYFLNEKNMLINSLEPIENIHETVYVSEIVQPLQRLAMDEMIKSTYAGEINQIDSKEKIIIILSDEFLNQVHTTDEVTGDEITLKEHLNKVFPTYSDETALRLFVETGYVFSFPMIPVPKNQLISIDEFCQLKIDEQKCNMIKRYATLAHMIIKKDPNAGLELAKIVLEIAIDLNDKTDEGYDSELLIIQYFVNKTSEELLDEKMFRLNGKSVSLNYLTGIQCGDTNISVAEKVIIGYNAKNKSLEEIKSEYIDLMHILQNIDESSCSIPILK